MLRRLKSLVLVLALAFPVVGVTATPAHACIGDVCDAINVICNEVKYLPDDCVR